MDNVEISPQLIAMFESSNDPWGIKLFNGERSFHFYSNNPNYHFLNLPLSFNVEGRPDGEIPHPSAEFSENFQHHDFEIKKQKRNISSIDIYHYGKELLLQPYLCEKFPFFYKKRCVGVIFHSRKINIISFKNFLDIKKPKSLTCKQTIGEFKKRETEIIFLTINSFSSKEVSKILGISHRTIENRLLNIYQKIGINSRYQLIEFCVKNNMDKNIPPSLLNVGSLLCR